MTAKSTWHAYTNGTDTILGESLQEAVGAYCVEIGIDALTTIDEFHPVDDDHKITITDREGDLGWKDNKRTVTARQWISEHGRHTRLLCTTEPT